MLKHKMLYHNACIVRNNSKMYMIHLKYYTIRPFFNVERMQ